ncbi:MAG: M48 family metallopeptidase [Chitinophagaceae bacterium]
MDNWTGIYKETNTSPEVEVVVSRERDQLRVEFPRKEDAGFYNEKEPQHIESGVLDTELFWKIDDLDIHYLPGPDLTIVRPFPGAYSSLAITGKSAGEQLAALPGRSKKTWEQPTNNNYRYRFAALLLIIIGFLTGLYFLLVPFIAGRIASQVSISTEEKFGESIYGALVTDIDTGRSELVNRFFRHMNVNTPYRIRITVVNNPMVNAFALPGGRIVIYTGLLDKLRDYPELAALLGHEFTHVQEKHSTRTVFRKVGTSVFLALVVGNTGSVGSVLANKADELSSLGYSRSLEREADLNGLELMRQRQIDHAGFSRLFAQLKTGDGSNNVPEFLASHPDLDQRILYVNEAAGNYPVRTDSILLSIFDNLKK